MTSPSLSPLSSFTATLRNGRYRLESELGQGGMGVVYLGHDMGAKAPVAIKALHPHESQAHSELLKRFLREGQLLRELNHPNIVAMLDAFEENGRHYLVTEYVAGGDLGQLLEEAQQLSIERSLTIALELADALTRAHHIRVIHRDIKPANILLAADGSLKLSDFGIAGHGQGSNLTGHQSVMGSIAYLSPEACLGQELDGRSDIWSFGVVLYQMVMGELPFEGENIAATLTAIMGQELPDMQAQRPDIPDGLADLVYRMLVKDRDGRIPSARLVGAELEGLLKGFKVTPRHDISTSATPKPDERERRIRLPVQASRFIGRKKELAEIGRLLGQPETRLLTLLGAGGMGKTRLGIEAARAQAERFADGVCFVDLAPLSDPDQIPRAMAEALSFTFNAQGSPQGQLLDYLRNKNLLLVLDNCEHLLDGVTFLAGIIPGSPEVKLLATSRAQLDLQDEQIFEVSGMITPRDEAEVVFEEVEAVELFLSYARRPRPDYELAEEDKPAVVQICRLVEGMPLGIQLAAAWTHTLSPREIADELSADLDFLTSRFRDVPERQRSMRAVFDHSWNLLPAQLREVFVRCSVFRGGFTREAAREVAGASVRALSALVERSMLQRTAGGRFHVHELMRQFATERLANRVPPRDVPQEAEVRDRHWDHFAALLSRLDTQVRGDIEEVRGALDAYQEEFDNIQTAWDWAVAQRRFDGMKAATMAIFWCPNWIGWDRDGYQMCLKAIRALEDSGLVGKDHSLQLLLWKLTIAAGGLGELSGMESRIDRQAQYLAILEQIVARQAIPDMGYWFIRLIDRIPPSYWETAVQSQLALYDLAIQTFREQGWHYEASEALLSKAWYFNNALKRKREALPLFEESLAVAKQARSVSARSFSEMALSSIRYQMGDYEEAYRLNHQVVNELRSWLGAKPSYLVILGGFSAACLAYLGEYGRAKQLITDVLADSQQSGNPNQRATGLMALFEINVLDGDLPAARQNLATYREMYPGYLHNALDLAQHLRNQGLLAYHEGEYAAAQHHIEDALVQFERNSGAPDSFWAAAALSLLGEVQRAAGQREAAWDTLEKAVRLNLSYTYVRHLMSALLGLASWLRDGRQLEEAVEVAALVEFTLGTIHHDRGRAQALLGEAESHLPSADFAAACERGQRLTPQMVYDRTWGQG